MPDRLDAIIAGAGPYGLSIASYLSALGMSFRIFGAPMETWRQHMPKGMFLKSDGFASSLFDPGSTYTLEHYCREQGIPYDDTHIPVRLETFQAYGLAFQKRFVPQLEDRRVAALNKTHCSFHVTLDNGESFLTNKVILAVGISHFPFVPPELAHLPAELLSHSSQHSDLESQRGRRITVLGSGASAIDLAALLRRAGAEVTLLARAPRLIFHDAPRPGPRPLVKRLRHPGSGLGPGWRSRFCQDAPGVFHHFPQQLRLQFVKSHLHPCAGWAIRDLFVEGGIPTLLGRTIQSAEARNGGLHLRLAAADGSITEHSTEHLIAATGYKVDLRRLSFLSDELRQQIRSVEDTPVLSRNFESSVPGLYFTGVAAANSFGPLLRFALGADFTSRTLHSHFAQARRRSA